MLTVVTVTVRQNGGVIEGAARLHVLRCREAGKMRTFDMHAAAVYNAVMRPWGPSNVPVPSGSRISCAAAAYVASALLENCADCRAANTAVILGTELVYCTNIIA